MADSYAVVSAARFVVNITGLPGGSMPFSELAGINSKVSPSEYIEAGATSPDIVHTKQFGKTEPPTITLKRGLNADGNNRLLAWHMLARAGKPEARGDGTLEVYDAGNNLAITYIIENGWCQELTISGVKAGDSAVATVEVKITCDNIKAGT